MKFHTYVNNNGVHTRHTGTCTQRFILSATILLLSASTCLYGQEFELFKSAADMSQQPSENDKKLKLPEKDKPISVKAFKNYKKVVDCGIFIDAGADQRSHLIAGSMFTALDSCAGQPAPDGKRYNPFVVIASIPLLFFSKSFDIDKLSDLEAYLSPKGMFAVFIPKGYDKEWLNKDLKPLATEDIKSLQIKENDYGIYKSVDIADLESIFSKKDRADTAFCFYLAGHGGFKHSIAEMEKKIYLQFLNVLNNLNSQFLYILSCYSGGINALIMHSPEDKSLIGSTNPEPQKEAENILFPIVVKATADEPTLGGPKLYSLNTFFGTLHAFLRSPTWDVGMTRKEWHKKYGAGPLVLMKDVLKPIFRDNPDIANLPSIFIPDHIVKGGIFFEATKVDNMLIVTNKNLEKLMPKITIQAPERTRIITKEGAIKSIKTMPEEEIRQLIKEAEARFTMFDKMDLTEEDLRILAEEKTIKKPPYQYVLIYPINLSTLTFEILGNTAPAFISKIGGNAFHCLGTVNAPKCKIENLIPQFMRGGTSSQSFKAWLIKEIKTKDDVWRHVIIFKPGGETVISVGDKRLAAGSYCLVLYQQDKDKKWYALQVTKGDLQNPVEISEGYYVCLLGQIKDLCMPDPRAVLKFTAGKETIETAQKTFEEFANSTIKFPIKINPKNEMKRVQEVYMKQEEPNVILYPDAIGSLIIPPNKAKKLDQESQALFNNLAEVLRKRSIEYQPPKD